MKNKVVGLLLAFSVAVSFTACGNSGQNTVSESVQTENTNKTLIEGASYITLSEEAITMDGDAVTTNSTDAVYVANDIIYYEEGKDFTYGEGTKEDEHSQQEAQKHTVVHITKPGTYVLSGQLEAGQIAVDLGKDAKDNPEAVVTLVLDNVDITCSVAPGIIFYNVYECSSAEEENATKDVDTSAAGANVLIADGSINTVNGSYVAKIYESVELNEDGTKVTDSKKLHKYDGAFYSKMSMNINAGEAGDGVLNINAANEGLDSELHLTINGGKISIVSGNDGINTNKDKVSVTTVNGGMVSIKVDGSTKEGDGIDSNGWLVINGGVVNTVACATSMDSGIDSDMGIHINGGTVIAAGNMLDSIASSEQNYVVFHFMEKVEAGSEITLQKGEETFYFTMPNDYTSVIVSKKELEEGTYTLWKGEQQLQVIEAEGGMGMMMPGGFGAGQIPEGFEPGQMPEGFEPGRMPEGFEPGRMPEDFESGQKPEGAKEGKKPEGGRRQIPRWTESGEMPEDFEPGRMPEGFEPGQMPEGFEPGERPEGGRGERFQNNINMENAVTEFEIKTGGNMFLVV